MNIHPLSAGLPEPLSQRTSPNNYHLLAMVTALILQLLFPAASIAAEYRLSMLPLFGAEEIHRRITPLAEYLSKETGLTITPILTADFSQYSQQLSAGAIHIGYENPYVYVMHAAYHDAVAMASTGGQGFRFRGIIITRKDSPIRSIKDLKGKKIAIVSQSSTGGFLSQSYSLAKQGIRLQEDCVVEEATENKQENVIFSVYNGDVDAGFIQEAALPQVKEFVPVESIRVLERTEWLPNWALSLSKKMPEADKKKIIAAIERLGRDAPALKAMKVDAFALTQDSEYDVVRMAAGLAKN
ncbi:MAG: phosphate/phosphite/phosphonate ABC transporter substrate-binding protein [Desulforhopalus sp.]|nr:phosphate/phosphite/phosphonate ABC transporter substrate-binding protein [Desulforhopalus sp.]